MPDVLDPRDDDRRPRYGCGPSFGMLGPSRLVVAWGGLAGPMAHLHTVIVPHFGDTEGEGGFMAVWKGTFGSYLGTVALERWSAEEGLWTITAGLSGAAPLGFAFAHQTLVNFTWQFAATPLTENLEGCSSCVVFRVPEWSPAGARWTTVLPPDH